MRREQGRTLPSPGLRITHYDPQNGVMIKVEGLTKKYKNFTAVDNISFTVEKGEIFGFLGPNGAGKTTTLRLLTGQLRPTSGKASVCGYDIVKERKKLRENIGVVFEYQNLYTRLSGRLNLDFFRKLYRLPVHRLDEVLEMVQLSDRSKDPVKDYSHGMKQRLLIARALLHRPEVLFLDEPTSGLDPHSANQIRKMILNLSSLGVTVFLTTHYLEEAEYLCGKVAIMDKGHIIALDRTEDLKYRYSSRNINIRLKEDGICNLVVLSIDNKDTGDRLKEYVNSKSLVSIHSEELTLEQVFLKITNPGKL